MNIWKEAAELSAEALKLACAMIADGPQTYEEAKTADQWESYFIKQAGKAREVTDD